MGADTIVLFIIAIFLLFLVPILITNAIYIGRLEGYAKDNPEEYGNYKKIKNIKITNWILAVIVGIISIAVGYFSFYSLKPKIKKGGAGVFVKTLYIISIILIAVLIPILIIDAIYVGKLQSYAENSTDFGNPETIKAFEIINWVLMAIGVVILILIFYMFTRKTDAPKTKTSKNKTNKEVKVQSTNQLMEIAKSVSEGTSLLPVTNN